MLKIIEITVKISLNYLKSKFIAKDFNQVKDNCAPEISKRYERLVARVQRSPIHIKMEVMLFQDFEVGRCNLSNLACGRTCNIHFNSVLLF